MWVCLHKVGGKGEFVIFWHVIELIHCRAWEQLKEYYCWWWYEPPKDYYYYYYFMSLYLSVNEKWVMKCTMWCLEHFYIWIFEGTMQYYNTSYIFMQKVVKEQPISHEWLNLWSNETNFNCWNLQIYKSVRLLFQFIL